MTINIFVWHMLVNISTGVVLLKDKAVENRIHEHGWNRDLVGTGTWLVQGPGWYRDGVGTGLVKSEQKSRLVGLTNHCPAPHPH